MRVVDVLVHFNKLDNYQFYSCDWTRVKQIKTPRRGYFLNSLYKNLVYCLNKELWSKIALTDGVELMVRRDVSKLAPSEIPCSVTQLTCKVYLIPNKITIFFGNPIKNAKAEDVICCDFNAKRMVFTKMKNTFANVVPARITFVIAIHARKIFQKRTVCHKMKRREND